MPWTKKNYPDAMNNLEEEVRNKAIDIANALIEEEYNEGRAISIAISRAKEWYENRGNDTSSDVTHHLVPEEDQWILKSLKGSKRLMFETKEEAMNKVKDMSKNQAMKVMIHDSNGKFQEIY